VQTYRFSVWIPRRVSLVSLVAEAGQEFEEQPSDDGGPEKTVPREVFYDWLWAIFGAQGLVGVHEGTLLSEDAAQQGMETESWLLDSAQAPASRDWIGQQEKIEAELYFSNPEGAAEAAAVLGRIAELSVSPVAQTPNEDWNAQWKASFLNAEDGFAIPPFWRIFPPWKKREEVPLLPQERFLRINPGAGFGTGTHETTQLCLQAVGEWSQVSQASGTRALDFGSGSGILAVGLGLLGARIDAVEVDPLAIDNGRENAEINGVSDRISYSLELPEQDSKYDLIVANILKPVLLAFVEQLTARLKSEGRLILSGLIEKDVAEVCETYSRHLPGFQVEEKNRGEWFALIFSRPLS
jgi:ribosomal protein L11 methyltransferase